MDIVNTKDGLAVRNRLDSARGVAPETGIIVPELMVWAMISLVARGLKQRLDRDHARVTRWLARSQIDTS
jgi:hypothetical protein